MNRSVCCVSLFLNYIWIASIKLLFKFQTIDTCNQDGRQNGCRLSVFFFDILPYSFTTQLLPNFIYGIRLSNCPPNSNDDDDEFEFNDASTLLGH